MIKSIQVTIYHDCLQWIDWILFFSQAPETPGERVVVYNSPSTPPVLPPSPPPMQQTMQPTIQMLPQMENTQSHYISAYPYVSIVFPEVLMFSRFLITSLSFTSYHAMHCSMPDRYFKRVGNWYEAP